jgi:predicted ABC-type ATPase
VPLCTIIAGPNGSGKSTVFAQLHLAGEQINTDEFARRISPDLPEGASLKAARQVLSRVAALLEGRLDFNFETTLSSHQSLAIMRRARDAGYRVELIFIALRSPEIHLVRVRQRVAQGGHDIPVETILRRYERSFANLPEAIRLTDQTVVYDNTRRVLERLVLIDGATIVATSLDPANALHRRIGQALARALPDPGGTG